MRVSQTGLRVTEVPSFEHRRLFGVSKLRAVPDGLRIVRTIFRERCRMQQETTGRPRPTVLDRQLSLPEGG